MSPLQIRRAAPRLVSLLVAGWLAACGGNSAPDTTSRVSSTVPHDQATAVSTTAALTANFAREMDPATITAQTFTLSTSGGAVAGTVAATATHATFTPAHALAPLTLHTATLAASITDAQGQRLPAAVVWTFTTGGAADTTPPIISTRDPADAATSVALNKVVTATFNKAMDPATISSTSFSLAHGGVAVAATVALDAAGTKASLTPTAPLLPSTVYTATVSAAAASAAHVALASAASWSFTTVAPADTTPPTVVSSAPATGAAAVPTNARLELVFSEAMSAASLTSSTIKLKQGSTSVAGAVSLPSDHGALFTPGAALAANKSFTLSVTTGAKDAAGNALAHQVDVAFTTGAGADATAPTLVAQSPADGEQGVATNRPVIAIFSEPLAPSTVSAASFAVSSGGAALAGALALSGATVTFTPAQPLPASATVSIALAATLADLAGNPLGAAVTSSFSTGASPDSTPPTLASTSPADQATGADVHAPLAATFSEPLLPASVNSATFALADAAGAAVPGAVSLSGSVATFTPDAALVYGGVYTATLAAGLADLAGNHLAADATFSFTAQPVPAVKINELAAKVASGPAGDSNGDGLTDSAGDEFIEVMNSDTAPADISGWVLRTGSSATALHDQFTFPAGTVLPAGGRAVVFGGGAPAGAFGGAPVFTTSGLSLTDSGAFAALVARPGTPDLFADGPFAYAQAPSSGASWVRSPEGSGAFVDHTTLSGSSGVLWSPGVAATGAQPKLNPLKSAPAAGATGVAPGAAIALQFNMAMLAQSLAADIHLYASDCATRSPEVAGAVAAAANGLQAIFTPTAPLAQATVHCAVALGALQSDARSGGNPVGAALGADASYAFTTGTIAFNVTGATALDAATISVTFSAPPDPTAAQSASSYCIADGAATSCAAPGSPAIASATLSGSTVTLSLAGPATASVSYLVFVSGVTRAADGAALGTSSAPFTGAVPAPFTLASAAATGETEVTLLFSQPPAAATADEFCIADGAAADCSTPLLAVSAVTAPAGNPSALVLTTAQQTKAQAYRLFPSGILRAADGTALATASAPLSGFRVGNGSFEKDAQPAGANATAAPAGWTMISSSAAGNLLHAEASDGTNGVPTAEHGLDVARFDSLTSSISGREAHSDCFPVAPAAALSMRGQVQIPSGQDPTFASASFKVWYFTDAACTAKSTVRASDTQTAAANSAAGDWEARHYAVAATPSDAAFAYVSLRAAYVSGKGASTSVVYFDDIAVTQP